MVFTTYNLSEADRLQGSILTTLQSQVIQNRIAQLAEEIVLVSASATDEKYFEKLNFQKGQIAELRAMLDASEQAEQYYIQERN
jgi:EcoRII C terminal.